VKPIGVDELLAQARAELERMSPQQAAEAAADRGALLIDIRAESQRERDGVVPGSKFIARNVLEWRADPSCSHRDPELANRDREVILFCDEGYQSSLAAATLRRFGLRATDLEGGFQAWRASGLPVRSHHSAASRNL
jgi:rhodanese-related sulfurtransferase